MKPFRVIAPDQKLDPTGLPGVIPKPVVLPRRKTEQACTNCRRLRRKVRSTHIPDQLSNLAELRTLSAMVSVPHAKHV